MLLGRNIAGRRKILGLTQAVLAEQLGIDTVTVSRFERGSHLPSLLRLEHIGVFQGFCRLNHLKPPTELVVPDSIGQHLQAPSYG